MSDMINKPKHYQSPKPMRNGQHLEAIDVIKAFGLGFELGNAIKYILRSDAKGATIEDLKKAGYYINDQIREMESARAAPIKAEVVEFSGMRCQPQNIPKEDVKILGEVKQGYTVLGSIEELQTAPPGNYIVASDIMVGRILEQAERHKENTAGLALTGKEVSVTIRRKKTVKKAAKKFWSKATEKEAKLQKQREYQKKWRAKQKKAKRG